MSRSTANHSNCEEKCSWPLLHENINKILNENIFRGIHLYNDNLGRNTRKRSLDEFFDKDKLSSSDTDLDISKLQKLSEAISEKLYTDVYRTDEKSMITTLKLLCDIKGLKMKVDERCTSCIWYYS